jgi:hypothetical protein
MVELRVGIVVPAHRLRKQEPSLVCLEGAEAGSCSLVVRECAVKKMIRTVIHLSLLLLRELPAAARAL